MVESIRELFQNFIAPQLESIKGEIKALDSKFEARIDVLDSRFEMLDAKVGSFRAELLAEIRRVEEVLSGDFVRLEQKVDLRLANMDTQLASTHAIMEARFESMGAKFDGMDDKFHGMDGRLKGMDARLGGMDAQLKTMNERLDLYRPVRTENLTPRRSGRKTARH